MWSIFSRSSLSSFPYELLETVSEDSRSIWKLHKGKRKQGSEEVSIFTCEGKGDATIDLAKAAIKRLKMLKHPAILKYIDSLENEKSVYLVTEAVTPVLQWLSETEMSLKNHSNTAAWGVLQITLGLSFLNNDGKLVHNNVNSSSVFVTRGGEWKLSGLEYTTADVAYSPIKVIPQLSVYDPPEMHTSNKKCSNLWASDTWGLGCFIWEVFNHQLDKSMSLQVTSKIPKPLLPTYCELVGANPSVRPNPKDIIEKLRKPGQFFNNDLIAALKFLDEIQIKDENEKHRFFSNLSTTLDNIPDFISKNKILPALLTAHEFSNVGSVLLTPLFKIGKILEVSEYQTLIVPCVVRMFSSTDRATRLKLLQQMETLADHLDPKTVNEQIFQPLITGFQDTNPTIKEYTVKAILYLAPKLNYNNLNVEILKHFARLQSRDDQGGIRTNTTVCLGKISSYLHPETRQKCLISAFTRAMRDPFPPSRIAGVTAIGATQQFYPLSDVATKILPALSQLTVDPEKSVRDAVFKVFKGFLGKLEKVSEDPELKEVMEKEVSSSSASSGAASWAGWAVGALASKFYKAPLSSISKETEGTSSEPSADSLSSSIENAKMTSSLTKPSQNPSPDQFSNERLLDSSYSLKQKVETSASTLEHNETLDEAGDGWNDDDDEDWGSLDVDKTSTEEASDSIPSSVGLPTSSSYGWSNSSSHTDFFSTAFEKGPSISNKQLPESKFKTSAKKLETIMDSSWDSWDSEDSKDLMKDTSNDKAEEQKRLREEKKAQRMKEIEARRVARIGPMKLGAKKMDPFL